jgi:hypothetical protein
LSEEREQPADREQALIDMAVESWRFSRVFSRLIFKLDAGESAKYQNQVRYFQKRIEESLAAVDLKIVNVEGQVFDPGIAASAINIADFDSSEPLMINQMIEPIIMGKEGLRRQGTVMVGRIAL